MYDKTSQVRIRSKIVKHERSKLWIQNRSATMLCANSTNAVLSCVERIHKNWKSLSIVGHPLPPWLHGLIFKHLPVSDPGYVVYNIWLIEYRLKNNTQRRIQQYIRRTETTSEAKVDYTMLHLFHEFQEESKEKDWRKLKEKITTPY